VPPITIVVSWLILGEVPRAVTILGGALCVAGVVLARRWPG
jgi:drug/metabolite transporter (DMT)-like permease